MGAEMRDAFLAAARAGLDRFGPQGLEYLYRLIQRMARNDRGFRQLKAQDLCRAFERQASADFGRLAPHVLERWGLATGGDLGRAVFLLADHRCLSLEEGETLEEYAAAGPFRFH
jgi:uncharacterized repeat protein (TIGR04138 family)